MTDRPIFVTTSIPYVNAPPHLGHALEFVHADVLARHARRRGRAVRLQSGTDDNALKNATAARAAGRATSEFVAANAARFARLTHSLEVAVDDVLGTSSDPRHAPGVRALWRRTAARGDFYRREYRGQYCPGCEQFYDPADLVAGRCPEHRIALEEVVESNWFFRLSRYADPITAALRRGELRITPEERRNEVLAWLAAGVRDISVSRPATRSGGWGIAVPDDPDQVIYVWWDALANYITALGYGTADAALDRWWRRSERRVHVVGKGILRFHAVYWPALLLSVGEPLPTEIIVHEYLTSGGTKISKSAGVQVDPQELIDGYGVDAIRWWLVADVARLGDTDFSVERLRLRYAQDLAGGIGNLVRRCAVLTAGEPAPLPAGAGVDHDLLRLAAALPGTVDRALEAFDLRAATTAITRLTSAANRDLEQHRPWERPPGDHDRRAVLARVRTVCEIIAGELEPFVPAGARRLTGALAADWRTPAPPVFAQAGSARIRKS
jgi:methionyl-tRNA synthetase